MKQETSIAYILRLTVTLLVICAVVAAALAGVNAITKDRIADVKAQKTLDALEEVLPGVTGLEEIPVTGDNPLISKVYASGDSYAVEVLPAGFNGTITMMVGITGGQVQGVSVISHAETPGLGAVAAESSAKGESFRGLFVGVAEAQAVDKDGGQIAALTGATITSRAIVAGVNAALDYVANLG